MLSVGYLGDVSGAIAYYRGLGPLSKLELDGKIKLKKISNNMHDLLSINMLYAVRAYSEVDLIILEKANKLKIPIIWDLDDDLFNIPMNHPAFPYYSQKSVRNRVEKALLLADMVVVSTEALKETILPITGNNIEVINNAIDERFLVERHNTEPNIVWRGGETHDLDLRTVATPLVTLANQHQVPVHLWGWYPWFLMGHVDKLEYHGPEEFLTYYSNFQESKSYVAVVPLVDNQFNRSKSNIAWLEATMAGAACLASGLFEFSDFGCVNFTDQASFLNELNMLLTQPDLVRAQYLNSFYTIKNNYTLTKTNKQRLELMEGL